MQGVETASLANDACGVPLPWMMTNPWLFFDGKLFHLKLKMSTIVQNLRDLCDNHIEIVLKIERFRKAILEDVEHFLLPAHMGMISYFLFECYFHQKYLTKKTVFFYKGFLQTHNLAQTFGKNQLHQISNIPTLSNGSTSVYFNVAQQQPQQQSSQNFYSNTQNNRNSNKFANRYVNQQAIQQQQQQQAISRQINRQGGYQLKVGGVVVYF